MIIATPIPAIIVYQKISRELLHLPQCPRNNILFPVINRKHDTYDRNQSNISYKNVQKNTKTKFPVTNNTKYQIYSLENQDSILRADSKKHDLPDYYLFKLH
jgi:hypothetical protein